MVSSRPWESPCRLRSGVPAPPMPRAATPSANLSPTVAGGGPAGAEPSRPAWGGLVHRGAAVVMLAALAGAGLWAARGHLLDDALIHLRLAEHLAQGGSLEYNPGERSFGSSSPVWLLALAGWQYVAPGPAGLGVLAVLTYGALFAAQAHRFWIGGGAQHLVLLGALAVPMAIRWLADGMETAAAALVAVVLVGVARRREQTVLLPAFLSALAVLTRIELVLLVAVCALLAARERPRARPLALAGGAAVGLLVTRVAFGAFVSDAGVAKSGRLGISPVEWLSQIVTIGVAQVAAMSFGCGLLAALALAWHAAWRHRGPAAVAMSLLPLGGLIAGAVLRAQAVQGIRYFVWAYIAAVHLADLGGGPASTRQGGVVGSSALRVAVLLPLLAAVLSLAEWRTFQRVVTGRSATLTAMRQSHLERLAGIGGIAWDIGFIGYFSRGTVCDPNGLVHGREVARLDAEARLDRCAALPLRWAFVNDAQLTTLARRRPEVTAWASCPSLRFDFPNVGGSDVHRLLLPAGDALQWCPAPARVIAAGQ